MKHPIIPDIDLDKISFARKYKKLLGNNSSGYLIQVLSKLNLYQQSLKTYYLLSRDMSALGSVLLPSGVRDFIEAKSRLVLCPHRTL
ncbi:MAG: hypothetical protein ACKPCP_38120, partial [Sphaerospermopsis kisseleviana]